MLKTIAKYIAVTGSRSQCEFWFLFFVVTCFWNSVCVCVPSHRGESPPSRVCTWLHSCWAACVVFVTCFYKTCAALLFSRMYAAAVSTSKWRNVRHASDPGRSLSRPKEPRLIWEVVAVPVAIGFKSTNALMNAPPSLLVLLSFMQRPGNHKLCCWFRLWVVFVHTRITLAATCLVSF